MAAAGLGLTSHNVWSCCNIERTSARTIWTYTTDPGSERWSAVACRNLCGPHQWASLYLQNTRDIGAAPQVTLCLHLMCVLASSAALRHVGNGLSCSRLQLDC